MNFPSAARVLHFPSHPTSHGGHTNNNWRKVERFAHPSVLSLPKSL